MELRILNLQQVDMYLNNKIKQDENCIIFTFYELRVKLNFSSQDTYNFLHLVSTKLENNNYKIYRTGQEHFCKEKFRVEDNQLLVAIKKEFK